jgi:hypothetical protein
VKLFPHGHRTIKGLVTFFFSKLLPVAIVTLKEKSTMAEEWKQKMLNEGSK